MATGIKEKNGCVMIDLRAIGGPRHTTQLPWNTANRDAMAKRRRFLIAKHRCGDFIDFGEEFPDSRAANEERSGVVTTFEDLSKLYLKTIDKVQKPTTVQQKRYVLEGTWWPMKMPHGAKTFGKTPIDQIKHSDIMLMVSMHPWESPKTRNNYVSIVSQAFELAVRDDHLTKNPCRGLARAKYQPAIRVTAYTVAQAEKMIGGFLHLFGPQWMHYATIGFFTGLRPSELVALRWTDVDFVKDRISVTHVRVAGVDQNTTKTTKARIIRMCPRAKAAFLAQRRHTGKATHGDIFEISEGEQIGELTPIIAMWHQVAQHVGLTELELTPKNMRSTSVSWHLTIATSPAEIPLIAKMHGHLASTMIDYYASLHDDPPSDEEKEAIREAMGRSALKVAVA